jgi:hypothetical protein
MADTVEIEPYVQFATLVKQVEIFGLLGDEFESVLTPMCEVDPAAAARNEDRG